jgi:glycosyltransferase involved in cell wall biosynthesis
LIAVRILYVSQYFPPEMGAPAARVSELAERWAARGHEVTVLTGFPHHPTGIVPPEYRGRAFARERWHGVDVVRAYVYATANKGVGKRALSYASFAASAVLMGPFAREARRADVVVATSPQFLCGLAGWALASTLRVPYVLEVRDLWPDSIVAVGIWPPRHPFIRGLRVLERFVYARASMLVAVTDSFVDTWIEQGVDPSKIRVVKNGVDLRAFVPRPPDAALRAELGLGDAFVVGYIGTHGLAHALGSLLDVAEALRHDPGVRFLLVGEGADKARLVESARARGLDNVVFVGHRSRDEIPRYVASCDIVAVTLRRSDLFSQVIPSKIFEIMGCARPILLTVPGEAQRIVRASGAGYFAAPEDPSSMIAAIAEARRDPAEARRRGERGRAYVVENFDRDRLADRYLEFLAELVEREP